MAVLAAGEHGDGRIGAARHHARRGHGAGQVLSICRDTFDKLIKSNIGAVYRSIFDKSK